MEQEFKDFTKIISLIVFMFTLIGHINFGFELIQFKTLWETFLEVLSIINGQYEYDLYDQVNEKIDNVDNKNIFVNVYTFAVTFSLNLFLLNVLIAFTSIAYMRYDKNSNGIYLTKIIGSRG